MNEQDHAQYDLPAIDAWALAAADSTAAVSCSNTTSAICMASRQSYSQCTSQRSSPRVDWGAGCGNTEVPHPSAGKHNAGCAMAIALFNGEASRPPASDKVQETYLITRTPLQTIMKEGRTSEHPLIHRVFPWAFLSLHHWMRFGRWGVWVVNVTSLERNRTCYPTFIEEIIGELGVGVY